MPRRKSDKEKPKAIGVEAIVEPGVGALYPRGTWMKKLGDLGKWKRKTVRESKAERK